ncbi:MAG: winged helix-turn-helix domain-containing protein [Pyrinomonadaceae bacterium]|nr:winged helix-turn-helix domain-containing protein [Pyrinomonadaceae bacterium]
MADNGGNIYEFDGFRLDVRERILSCGGKRLQIRDKAFDLLCALVDRSGSLVTKDELLSAIWPDTIVEENTLDKNVSLLRRLFSERLPDKHVIETVRGHGYRFALAVTTKPNAVASLEQAQQSSNPALANASEVDSSASPYEIGLHKLPPELILNGYPADESPTEPFKPLAGTRSKDSRGGRGLHVGLISLGSIALLILLYVVSHDSRPPHGGEPEARKIAVLPLANRTRDPNIEYLTDGITEGIIDDLAQLPGIKVLSRDSVFRFKNSEADMSGIASQLGADFVMSGEIDKVGDQFVISVRLVDSQDGAQIWGHQYVNNDDSLLRVQKQITLDVEESLHVKLGLRERGLLARGSTHNPAAYRLYLLGHYHNLKMTEPELLSGIQYFRKATEVDPGFAQAYVGLANCYLPLGIAGWHMPSRDALKESKSAATKALELDPKLATAHSALAWTLYLLDHDWNAAEKEFRQALTLSPFDSDIHRGLSHMLSLAGHHEEAIAEGERSLELDPLSLVSNTIFAQTLFFGGRTDDAIAQLNKTFEIESDFWIARNLLGRIYVSEGRYPEALHEFETARDHSGGGSIVPIAEIGYTYAKMGDRANALKLIEALHKQEGKRFVSFYSYAIIYNGLGDRKAAMVNLARSIHDCEADSLFLKAIGRWKPYMEDPKFDALIRPLNFEPTN